MRLFGELGYSATSVAQIEAAAGLSPGSGSLYKHFRSKEALLTEGLDRVLSGRRQLADLLSARDPDRPDDQLIAVGRLALQRMDEDRDVSRLLFRGLQSFPQLLQRFGTEEIAAIHQATATMLADLAGADAAEKVDWEAVAVVLQGAVAHYWLLADLFGKHPSGVDEDRLVAAVAGVAAAMTAAPHTESKPKNQPRKKK